jgi:hypothetical protein
MQGFPIVLRAGVTGNLTAAAEEGEMTLGGGVHAPCHRPGEPGESACQASF